MQPTDPNYWNPGDETQAPGVQPANEVDSPLDPATQGPEAEQEPYYIAWEASEYLQHDNGIGWYLGFIGAALVLILFAIFVLHFWLFGVVVLLMAIAGIIHVRQPPKVMQYRLDDAGLSVSGVTHAYSDYKSFSVIRDGAFFAVLLMPARRIALSTIVYFEEADGEDIVDELGAHLPMEHRGLAPLDRFLRLIRF